MKGSARARLLGALAGLLVVACGKSQTHQSPQASSSTQPSSSSRTPSFPSTLGPEPRKGMAFIPPGALVTGSPPNSYPRRPDRELSGEQVMLKGYYIDRFAFPNEEGAIPRTNVSLLDASSLCQKAGKRLCTELEWERACKGPSNNRYSWGEHYRVDTCQLGAALQPRPSGMRVGCHSDFDVFDLHGGVLEWTQSPWRRGAGEGRFVLKGGNGVDGELLGRCANAEGQKEDHRSGKLGFRCCFGPVNVAEVVIQAQSGEAIERIDSIDRAQFERLTSPLAGNDSEPFPEGSFSPERAYHWRPVGNETLVLHMACAKTSGTRRCGLVVGRDTPGSPTRLAFVETGVITSSLHMDSQSDVIWLLGLDAQGSFKRKLSYQAGRAVVGPKDRNVSKTRKRHGPQ